MSVRIGLGVSGGGPEGPGGLFRLIDLCEQSEIDSVWFSERLVSSQPSLEPMTAMAIVAGRTEQLKFGMNVLLLPFRDVLSLAKECATLDYLSGGRLLPAFGVGAAQAPEWRATRRDPAGRGALADEMIEAMQRLWSEERVTFHGSRIAFDDAAIAPRPVQQPLPCWIGGSSDAAIRRTARLGSGWLAGIQTPAQVKPIVARIRAASAEAGRPLDPDHYGAGFAFRFGSWEEPIVERTAALYARLGNADARHLLAVGTAADIITRCDEYLAAGISKFVLRPIAASDDEALEQTRRLIDEVVPVVHTRPVPAV